MCYDGAGKTVENPWFEYFKDPGFGIQKAQVGVPGISVGGGGGEGVFHHILILPEGHVQKKSVKGAVPHTFI